MRNLVRFYYKNKYKIWRIIIFIVLLLVIIQLINGMVANKNEINNKITESSENNVITESQNKNTQVTTSKSVVTGNDVNEKSLENASELIEKFISNCNNGDIQQAYDLISEECKNEQFPTVEDFKTLYYDGIFNNKRKIVTIENWFYNTYKVKFTDDILATGKYSDEQKQDYITITKNENDEYKLNLNGYIEKTNPKASIEEENIQIKVETIDTYMDYEIYTFEIANNSENNILIDNLENIKSLYLQDKNGVKYSAYTHELATEQLLIKSRETRKVKIKYYSKYSSSKDIQKVVFSQIILNYDNYSNVQNKAYYSNYLNLEVNI